MWLAVALGMEVGLLSHPAWGQRPGERIYAFLDLPVAPRLAGLGGKTPALVGLPEPALAVYNPALASRAIDRCVAIGYAPYFAGTHYNNMAYFQSLGSWGSWGVSVRQLWYGRFVARDEQGAAEGSFTAYDLAIGAHYAFAPIRGLSIGLSISPILSLIGGYGSVGLTSDVGAVYQMADGLLAFGVLARNLGGAFKHYAPYEDDWASFELLAGMSLTLRHAPLRFVLTLQHLETWNARRIPREDYFPAVGDGRSDEQLPSTWQRVYMEVLAHPILGVELVPGRYFYLQVGFNPSQIQTMSQNGAFGLAGLSYGAGVHYRRFALRYARSHSHFRGATHHVSLFINLAPHGTTERLPLATDLDVEPPINIKTDE